MEPSSPAERRRYVLSLIMIAGWVSAILLACENNVSRVYEVTRKDSLPVVISHNLQALHTDQGKLQLKLTAPLVHVFIEDEARQEFPEGVHVVFYDIDGNPKSELTAGYGVSFDNTGIMEARRNVHVQNFARGEKINTEHLVWNQRDKRIYSNVFVKITTPSEVIFGENGFESDESMANWVIRRPKGEFNVDNK